MYYNLIASAEESTVLAQYVCEERAPYAAYQSEAALERALIGLLEEEDYTYLQILDEASALRDGRFKTTGTAIDTILPPVRRFGGARAEKKAGVIEKLKAFFATFMGLVEE